MATAFTLLVDKRNDLLHAKPATGGDGKPCLFRWTPDRAIEWAEADILALAHEFEDASIEANALLYHPSVENPIQSRVIAAAHKEASS